MIKHQGGNVSIRARFTRVRVITQVMFCTRNMRSRLQKMIMTTTLEWQVTNFERLKSRTVDYLFSLFKNGKTLETL